MRLFSIGWYPWGSCSEKCAIGTYDRHRVVVTPPTHNGRSCPNLKETGNCGEINGGCDDFCAKRDGSCAFFTAQGYKLQSNDINILCCDQNL